MTVRGLCDAVRAGDIDGVRAMPAVRPELVHLDVAEDDEHRALHHAVLQRRPEIVRLLMQHGADARKGIWPHRDATSPLTLATERGQGRLMQAFGSHSDAGHPTNEANRDRLLREGTPVTVTIPLPAGARDVKVVVYDYGADLLGTATARIR